MRSLAQIKQEIIDDILELRSDVRIVEGDTQHDVVVSAPATQFYKYEVLLELEDRTRNLDSFKNIINDTTFKQTVADVLGYKQDGTAYDIDDVTDLISDRLDAYVTDWGITRDSGSSASTTVRVYLSSASTVSWNSGTSFTSKSGETYTPTTAASNVVPTFDSTVGLYYVDISVSADNTGSATNGTTGAIRNMDPKPSNFSYCTNTTAITGGSDREEDLDLIARAENVWSARVNGSSGAYERLAEAESYVDDAHAMEEDNEDDKIYLGSVCDIHVQFAADDTEMVEETFYWPGEANNTNYEQFDFIPKNQPLDTTVTPIVFIYTTGGTESQVDTTASNTEISIVQDTDPFGYSTKANDKIRIKMPLDTATYQRKLKVLYVYDKNPYKLQSEFDDSENRMVGPSVLVKKAVAVPVRVIVEIETAFGYTESDVQTSVTSNIGIYFNGGTTSYGKLYARKEIGEDVDHSDIAGIILRTEGVASYDNDTFFVINTLTGDLSDPVTTKENQYVTLYDVVYTYNTYSLSDFNASSQGL